MVHEQLDHLPFFLHGGGSTRRAVEDNLHFLIRLIGSQRNHASRVLGHHAQHLKQGLPHQRCIHQNRRQIGGQIHHQLHRALIHQRLEHRQRRVY